MKRTITKVLVANRGEIAIRIFRTLREMGIRSVAIFSGDDADALHVAAADESYLIHGSSLADNYLNQQRIIQVAKQAGADAIHPGYGFLSESHTFSGAVRQAGLIFIGPGDEAIRLMGNKVEARTRVAKLGVPLIEGATGNPDELEKLAEKIGFPILVKAAAGGGGKGMRIAGNPNELREMLETAQREAFNYFGNGEVYIEKYLASPHHIEVQLMADEHGRVVTLFERECSLQRRYQKIIEEAPSPNVGPKLRQKLMRDARIIAEDIGYVNAGTIEFLVSGDHHYFLEMNTRIQVEHPVTEMITGIDIVREQVNIARGEPLSFSQDEIRINGHAVEARVYAEDPKKEFLPSPGKIVFYKTPKDQDLRIDGSMSNGAEVSSQFDPMISKVISHAPSREEARSKLLNGLKAYLIHGIKTNIPFLVALLQSEAFMDGSADTNFCKQFLQDGFLSELEEIPDPDLFTAAFVFAGRSRRVKGEAIWNQLGHWRLCMRTGLIINGKNFNRSIHTIGPEQIYMEPSEKKVIYHLLRKTDHEMHIDASGVIRKLFFTLMNDGSVLIQQNGRTFLVQHAMHLNRESLKRINNNPVLEGTYGVHAPMFGKVIQVIVKPDDIVNKGDTLVILESMKMENRVVAMGKGRVQKIEVHSGQLVQDNQVLVVLSNVI
ncbi:MAG: biotin carboxylase N-terminal domain-containing protein [Bacteroides sp.]|jgi:acetyl/propionyl-CoA carboxylase alpha subunit|nr:biotin carboxylase N-terminal domain-containing protein [Bacteroides sp.]